MVGTHHYNLNKKSLLTSSVNSLKTSVVAVIITATEQ
jgi:hypothetical protein